MSRLAAVLLTIVLLFPLSSCDDNPTTSQPEPELTSEAQAAIGAIYNAIKMYRQDKSEDPASVDVLETEEYITIDPEVKQLWSFRLIGCNPVTQIYAETTVDFPNGAGHTMVFDVQTGRFSGYGSQNSQSLQSALYCAIKSIKVGAEQYLEDHHRQVATFDILHNNGYVHITSGLLEDWAFMYVHDENKLVSIHAIARTDSVDADFNLVNYYAEEDQYEVLQIDDPKSKEIMRIMPEIMKAVFLYEAEHAEKPDFVSMIWTVYDIDYDPEIYDKYYFQAIDLEKNYQISIREWDNRGSDLEDSYKFILPIGKFSGGCFPKSDLTEIMASFGEIYLSVRELYRNSISIQDLIDEHYLKYSEDVINNWDFFFYSDGWRYHRISAIAKEFNDEYDFHFVTMQFGRDYESYPGQFSTSRAINPAIKPLIGEFRKINDAIMGYRTENSEDASSVEYLERTGFLDLDPDLKSQWWYSLIGSNPVSQIEAISSNSHPEGAGHVLLYDFQSGEFLGYGMDKGIDWEDQ